MRELVILLCNKTGIYFNFEEEKEQEKKKVRLKTKGHENKERVLANKRPRRAHLISTARIALVDGEAS